MRKNHEMLNPTFNHRIKSQLKTWTTRALGLNLNSSAVSIDEHQERKHASVFGLYWNQGQATVVQISQLECIKAADERLFLDLRAIKPPNSGILLPKLNWRIRVDEWTKFKVSHLFQCKDQIAEDTCELLKWCKQKGASPIRWYWSKTSFLRNEVENRISTLHGSCQGIFLSINTWLNQGLQP